MIKPGQSTTLSKLPRRLEEALRSPKSKLKSLVNSTYYLKDGIFTFAIDQLVTRTLIITDIYILLLCPDYDRH